MKSVACGLVLGLLCGLLAAGCTPKPARTGTIVASPGGAESASIDYPTTDFHEILEDVAAHFHLKLDGPHDLHGQTSITLRDVTWRQIFKVTLTPVGYDFYERDGMVVIRPKEIIEALPDEIRVTAIKHQSVAEMIEYLNRIYADTTAFSPAENSVVYRAHPKRLSSIAAEIERIDAPNVRLKRFPRLPHLPERLPELSPIPAIYPGFPEGFRPNRDDLTTEVFTLQHIDIFLIKPYLDREIKISVGSRILPDIRINALIVSAPESAMPRLAAIITYLDDERWYDPASARTQDATTTPENPAATTDPTAKPASP